VLLVRVRVKIGVGSGGLCKYTNQAFLLCTEWERETDEGSVLFCITVSRCQGIHTIAYYYYKTKQ